MLIFFAGCSTGPTNSKDEPAIADAQVVDVTKKEPASLAEPAKAEIDTPKKPLPLLASGSHSVFGLKMPRGMIPINSPDKSVTRFEGTHEIKVLKRYILSQIKTDQEIKKEEKGGFLIRRAQVLNPDNTDSVTLLAIRIFNGSLGGGSVDIWKEKETKTLGKSSRVGSSLPSYKTTPLSSQTAPFSKESLDNVPRTREQQMMFIMNKIEKGEKLTPQDLESPFFY